jgi:hypothetical protein
MRWTPPIELTPREERLCRRLEKHRRFFRFLRLHRHRLFDDGFQERLATMYAEVPRGNPPTSPALLATVVLLQAYAKASDDDAVQLAETDARWQLVLDCLGAEDAPFGKATLVDFRARFVAAGLHDELLRRTVELAKETRNFGYKQAAGLRIAVDSSPLEGAGKVEDTINLLGHALRILVHALAALVLLTPAEVIAQARLTVVGATSIKAGLDQEWGGDEATQHALQTLQEEVQRVTAWIVTRQLGGREHAGRGSGTGTARPPDGAEHGPGRSRPPSADRGRRARPADLDLRSGDAPRSQERDETDQRLQAVRGDRPRHEPDAGRVCPPR